MNEMWKSAPGFEGYEVSNLGRVRRVGHGAGARAGHILKPSIGKGKCGYWRVFPCVNGKKHNALVHVLMMTAFVGPRPVGHGINHKNGIKTDNRFKNLEYITARDNNVHALLTGLRKPRPILQYCHRGHLKTGVNSIHVRLDGTVAVRPRCRQCHADSARTAYHRRRGVA